MTENTKQALLRMLHTLFPAEHLAENAPMSRYTTLRMGGPADVLAEISSAEQLSAAVKAARSLNVPVLLMGNGSNLLVRDGGVDGLVLHFGNLFSEVALSAPRDDGSTVLSAQAGATLQKLSGAALEAGLIGLEFASGIPGTVGGAVYMNAGAYGGEMKQIVTSVTVMEPDGSIRVLGADEMEFGYRHSALNGTGRAAIKVSLRLVKGDPEAIRAQMRDLSARRREKQPVTLPSCGSTFKRPAGHYAAALIEQCGLKGMRVGGACISEKHAGFLVNDRGGTAADYLALMRLTRQLVLMRTGVWLEPEVQIIGKE